MKHVINVINIKPLDINSGSPYPLQPQTQLIFHRSGSLSHLTDQCGHSYFPNLSPALYHALSNILYYTVLLPVYTSCFPTSTVIYIATRKILKALPSSPVRFTFTVMKSLLKVVSYISLLYIKVSFLFVEKGYSIPQFLLLVSFFTINHILTAIPSCTISHVPFSYTNNVKLLFIHCLSCILKLFNTQSSHIWTSNLKAAAHLVNISFYLFHS